MRALTRAGCLLAVVAAVGTASSSAGFTAQRTNPANQFSAASSFERMRVVSGTYTGNGADNRAIAAGLAPDLVIVKANGAQAAVARTSTMAGDSSKRLAGANANAANMIQALQPTGFQVGTSAVVNASGVAYSWVAITRAHGTMAVGTYTGNGAASRAVAGLGFSPEAVFVLGANASAPVLTTAGMPRAFAFDAGSGIANAITALGADGFTVANSNSANANAQAYHYVAFDEGEGLVDVGSYSGDGTASRSIGDLGLAPALALVRSSSTTASRAAVWRPAAVTGNASLRFNAAANNANAITALGADGFTVGANADANAASIPYGYLTLADEAPG